MDKLWHTHSLRGINEIARQPIENPRAFLPILLPILLPDFLPEKIVRDIKKEAKDRRLGIFEAYKYRQGRYHEEERRLYEEYGEKVQDNLKMRSILYNIICPQCLKSAPIEKIEVTCPFCEKVHTQQGDGGFYMAQMLYDHCTCGSMIRYIQCIHCETDIDLFAFYDYEALERRRYE